MRQSSRPTCLATNDAGSSEILLSKIRIFFFVSAGDQITHLVAHGGVADAQAILRLVCLSLHEHRSATESNT